MSEPTDFKYRTSRCHDCGFTPGTEANKSGLTSIKATLCAEIPEPFYCHFNADNGELAEGKEVFCQGWVEACNIFDALGHYESQTDFQREFKRTIVETIGEIEEKGIGGDDAIQLVNDAILRMKAQL